MKSGEHFDVIIIGAGPSGIFCAYELIKEKPELNILMIEKGRPIEKRVCPKRKTKVCVGCKPCSITTGFAGAGAFSDGKLSLSPEEIEAVKSDMSRMLEYIDMLNQLDTSEVEPMSHVFDIHNVFREDVVENGDESDAMLSNAPEQKEKQYKVPRTVE